MNSKRKLIALSLLSLFLILPFRINAKVQDDFPTLREGLYYKYSSLSNSSSVITVQGMTIRTQEIIYKVTRFNDTFATIEGKIKDYWNGTLQGIYRTVFIFTFEKAIFFIQFAYNISNLRENILEEISGGVSNDTKISFVEEKYNFKGNSLDVYNVSYNYADGLITYLFSMCVDKKSGLILERNRVVIERTNYTIASYSQNEHTVLVDTNFFGKAEIIIFIIIIVIIAIPIAWWLLWKKKS